jgi:hypothetical protein
MSSVKRSNDVPQRPLSSRGFDISYVALPIWACRLIAILATLAFIFVSLVGERVIFVRLARSHGEVLSIFGVSVFIVVLMACFFFCHAARAWRAGWPSETHKRAPTK